MICPKCKRDLTRCKCLITEKEIDKALKKNPPKFGSKVEAKWTEVQERTEESIIADKINLRISEEIMKICKIEIEKEKAKFK